jgi:hypothetical protein
MKIYFLFITVLVIQSIDSYNEELEENKLVNISNGTFILKNKKFTSIYIQTFLCESNKINIILKNTNCRNKTINENISELICQINEIENDLNLEIKSLHYFFFRYKFLNSTKIINLNQIKMESEFYSKKELIFTINFPGIVKEDDKLYYFYYSNQTNFNNMCNRINYSLQKANYITGESKNIINTTSVNVKFEFKEQKGNYSFFIEIIGKEDEEFIYFFNPGNIIFQKNNKFLVLIILFCLVLFLINYLILNVKGFFPSDGYKSVTSSFSSMNSNQDYY